MIPTIGNVWYDMNGNRIALYDTYVDTYYEIYWWVGGESSILRHVDLAIRNRHDLNNSRRLLTTCRGYMSNIEIRYSVGDSHKFKLVDNMARYFIDLEYALKNTPEVIVNKYKSLLDEIIFENKLVV